MAYNTDMPKENFKMGGRTVFGYKPVYWDDAKGDWQIVDTAFPFPVNNQTANMKLDALKAAIEAQETITKKVEVTNQPNVQTVDGSISVDNLPEIQKARPVDGNGKTVFTQGNPGNTSVENFPGDYPDSVSAAELQAIKQTQSDILAKLNGTVDTQVTGSKVKETVVNGLVISDTNSQTFDNSVKDEVKELSIFANSSLDADITIQIRDAGTTLSRYRPFQRTDGSKYEIKIPAGSSSFDYYVSSTEWSILKHLTQFQYSIQASTPPSSGSITIVEIFQNR